VEYPGNDLEKVDDVDTADSCCAACAENDECLAWSWQSYESTCFLKGNRPRDKVTLVRNDDFTSGVVERADGGIDVVQRAAGTSLYCFALFVPDTYEEGLLEMQYNEGVSLFACDDYALFTNQDVKIADAVEVVNIDVDLRCPKGGEFGTALNTDIFLAVWDKVVDLDKYRHHDWAVKVDPDCAFSPARLRDLVLRHPETGEGVYLDNCQLGMHGPVEVFSRQAVRVFAGGKDSCAAQLQVRCHGPCEWGEDMYLDQCLQLLRVRREYEPLLLVEDHCNPPPGWDSCTYPGVTAFHPFKDVDQYRICASRIGE
jgi:hypothetical protein